jgi:hypothetical protein
VIKKPGPFEIGAGRKTRIAIKNGLARLEQREHRREHRREQGQHRQPKANATGKFDPGGEGRDLGQIEYAGIAPIGIPIERDTVQAQQELQQVARKECPCPKGNQGQAHGPSRLCFCAHEFAP